MWHSWWFKIKIRYLRDILGVPIHYMASIPNSILHFHFLLFIFFLLFFLLKFFIILSLSKINNIIDIPIIVSHCILVRSKFPFSVHNKLIKMLPFLEWKDYCGRIPILFHLVVVFPVIKTPNNKNFLTSKVPIESIIHHIRLLLYFLFPLLPNWLRSI